MMQDKSNYLFTQCPACGKDSFKSPNIEDEYVSYPKGVKKPTIQKITMFFGCHAVKNVANAIGFSQESNPADIKHFESEVA